MTKEEHHERFDLRNIQLFSKKVLLFPCHEDHHWSLFVVINPSLIESKESEACYIVHFDSLARITYHNTRRYTKKLCDFLNGQWQIEKGNFLTSPFNYRASNMTIKPKGKCLQWNVSTNAVKYLLIMYFTNSVLFLSSLSDKPCRLWSVCPTIRTKHYHDSWQEFLQK